MYLFCLHLQHLTAAAAAASANVDVFLLLYVNVCYCCSFVAVYCCHFDMHEKAPVSPGMPLEGGGMGAVQTAGH